MLARYFAASLVVLLIVICALQVAAVGHGDSFVPGNPPILIYTSPLTKNLRPSWWRSDGGSYGLPPAAERPDFWAGDRAVHTYHARAAIPQCCARRRSDGEEVALWRYYGGPKGWTMSPYY